MIQNLRSTAKLRAKEGKRKRVGLSSKINFGDILQIFYQFRRGLKVAKSGGHE